MIQFIDDLTVSWIKTIRIIDDYSTETAIGWCEHFFGTDCPDLNATPEENGQVFDLRENIVMMVDFWAAWCKTMQERRIQFGETYEEYIG